MFSKGTERLWHFVAFMIFLLIFQTVTFVLLAEISSLRSLTPDEDQTLLRVPAEANWIEASPDNSGSMAVRRGTSVVAGGRASNVCGSTCSKLCGHRAMAENDQSCWNQRTLT